MLCDESNPSNEMVQTPSVIALTTPIYHLVVPSSSSSISTLTLFFKRNGCLSSVKLRVKVYKYSYNSHFLK